MLQNLSPILSSLQVKTVVVEVEELISQIKADHRIQKKIDEPLSINIFTSSDSAGETTTELNGKFVFFQVLIDYLLQLKSNETDKNELMTEFKTRYEGNYFELNNLREFEQSYSSDEVLRWYTRESFFYKTLNAALRTQNIHRIFLFRLYIFDIHRQLQCHQANQFLRVYRSQLMSSDELNSLKRCIGQHISVNSFLSTSKERLIALFYMGDTTQLIDLERVLFEIDADPRMNSTKPFADISSCSNFPGELEVLFMIGSIFRLNSIHRNNDRIWIIRMALCNDDELDFKQVLMCMKEHIRSEEPNLRTLGKKLWKMGELSLAEKYFTRLLEQLPPDDLLRRALYEDLGDIASQKRDYDMSVQWHQKLFAIKKKNKNTEHLDTDKASNSIGEFIEKQSIILEQVFKQKMIFYY